METTKENGGSFVVDLNENEEGGGGGGGRARLKSYIALKDHSSALLVGVSGDQEAGKGHVYVTGNGRNVNRDASGQPPPHNRDIMLDLVAAESCLSGQLADGCVISGVCGGLNGFTESFGQEEPTMVGLDGAGGGGGLGLAGTTAASCPAVLLGCGSAETGRQMRKHPTGESEGETPDSGDVSPLEESITGCVRTSLRLDRLPCTGKPQRNCACIATTLSCPDVNMPNGDVDGTGCEADVADCERTGVFSSPVSGQRLGLCDVDCGDVKVANGGLHILKAARETGDCDDSHCSPRNNTDIHLDPGERRESGAGSGFSLRSQSDRSGTLVCQCPGVDAPSAADPSPTVPSGDSVTLGSSAKLASACPSTASKVSCDRPISEPSFTEDEEDFSDLSFPVRPQSLRTNPNIAVSLSCDATPLSPDEDGGFYFGVDGYEEDFRSVLEAGRRQSAPDQLPDSSEHTTSSDNKLMPKRFGIADFFTR